jgi:hypothetical protein
MEEVITAESDTEEIRELRANWGVFRDRRPDLYWPLMALDAATPQAGALIHLGQDLGHDLADQVRKDVKGIA